MFARIDVPINTRLILRPGYIYGIRQRHTGHLKVGKSAIDPRDRLSALQVGNPSRLSIEFSISTYNLDVAERYAHQALEQQRIPRTIGEWFRVPFWKKKHARQWAEDACGRASADLINSLILEKEEIETAMYGVGYLPCPQCGASDWCYTGMCEMCCWSAVPIASIAEMKLYWIATIASMQRATLALKAESTKELPPTSPTLPPVIAKRRAPRTATQITRNSV